MKTSPLKTTSPLFITGPTASGKSGIAALLAKSIGGEVINADPYQSYAGLPILTAQPEPELLDLVPHHLYGITPLDSDLTAPKFAKRVTATAAELHSRGITPIIVTGSGLYFRSLTQGLDSTIPAAEPTLRAELENTGLPDLIDRLYALDPESADTIDIHNPRRVIRTLEICILTGKKASELRTGFDPDSIAWVRGIYLDIDRPYLHQRIAQRAERMFAAGVEKEVAALAATEFSATASNTLGLDLVREVLTGKLPRAGALDLLTIGTRQYAKRQHTWFKKERALTPIDVTPKSIPDDLLTTIRQAMAAKD